MTGQPKPRKRKRKEEFQRLVTEGDTIIVKVPRRGFVRITGPEGTEFTHEPHEQKPKSDN